MKSQHQQTNTQPRLMRHQQKLVLLQQAKAQQADVQRRARAQFERESKQLRFRVRRFVRRTLQRFLGVFGYKKYDAPPLETPQQWIRRVAPFGVRAPRPRAPVPSTCLRHDQVQRRRKLKRKAA